MVIKTPRGQAVLAHFPQAESVFVLSTVRRWETAALPMRRRDEDGLWEVVLPEHSSTNTLSFFVRGCGASGGRICHCDCAVA